MKLLIDTAQDCLLLDAVNIALTKGNEFGGVPHLVVSCSNREEYRIKCLEQSPKNVEEFVKYCRKMIKVIYDNQRQGTHSFTLNFCDYKTNCTISK